MALRAQKRSGAFEKRAPAGREHCAVFLERHLTLTLSLPSDTNVFYKFPEHSSIQWRAGINDRFEQNNKTYLKWITFSGWMWSVFLFPSLVPLLQLIDNPALHAQIPAQNSRHQEKRHLGHAPCRRGETFVIEKDVLISWYRFYDGHCVPEPTGITLFNSLNSTLTIS